MQSVAFALCALLAACALPPRVDDRSTPAEAYRTFRGAIARGEHAREWASLSDDVRHALGLKNRGDWSDARALVLDQGHLLVRGICRSSVAGERRLADGRVQLDLSFPFGYEAHVVMRRETVLRAFAEGEPDPVLYELLDQLRVTMGDGGLVIALPGDLPPDLAKWIREELARPLVRVEVVKEWFLDDFSAAGETPRSVRRDLDRRGGEP